MNIRWKVTALVATLFAILGAAALLVAQEVLIPSFTELENADANTAMRRINKALDLTLAQLSVSSADWGNWTDTYRFAQDRNRAFIDENMTAIALKQLNINLVIVTDLEGRYVTLATTDLVSGQPLSVDLTSRQELPEGFPLRARLQDNRPARGFLRTNRGILMMASSPVLNGFGAGPSRGMVLMGRLLSAAEIERLADQAQAHLSMSPTAATGPRRRLVASDDTLQVYQTFNDVYDRPAFTLRVDLPRGITQRGHMAVRYASLYLGAAVVLVLLLLAVTLHRLVLAPLAEVTRHAVAFGRDEDLTTRLDFTGDDEIGVLARELDRMVERLAQSRHELVDQSFQAGFAEQARGVLHNMGNAMTPLGVRLSMLQARLRETPAEDAQLALTELERGNVDPARRPDLEEFVRLACGQLAELVRSIAADVEIMSRQTSVVQAALVHQMRSTRNEHVIEAVRLPELLAQSLEVVPDSARARLVVEADRSMSNVGVVSIPRTVLRLVLQNFIINAADSVREAGRDRGVFRVGADLVTEGDRMQLHLICTDDGVGIAAENIGRIFEKGFSTKSKETNFGIGLHWCANAVAALGGRVWASSDGPGRGASLHLLVPVVARYDVPDADVKAA